MKNTLLRVGTAALVTIFVHNTSILTARIHHETDIFGKWLASQQIYRDCNIAELQNNLNDTFLDTFKKRYQKNLVPLKGLIPLLSVLSNNNIQADGFFLRSPFDDSMRANLAFLYENIQNNMPCFIDCLVTHGMASRRK